MCLGVFPVTCFVWMHASYGDFPGRTADCCSGPSGCCIQCFDVTGPIIGAYTLSLPFAHAVHCIVCTVHRLSCAFSYAVICLHARLSYSRYFQPAIRVGVVVHMQFHL